MIPNFRQGQIMLLTVLVLGTSIMAASTIAGYLMILKLRQSSDIANSAKAIFAADTGIEWDLYRRIKNPNYAKPTLINDASFEVFASSTVTESVGKAGNSFRALKLSF